MIRLSLNNGLNDVPKPNRAAPFLSLGTERSGCHRILISGIVISQQGDVTANTDSCANAVSCSFTNAHVTCVLQYRANHTLASRLTNPNNLPRNGCCRFRGCPSTWSYCSAVTTLYHALWSSSMNHALLPCRNVGTDIKLRTIPRLPVTVHKQASRVRKP